MCCIDVVSASVHVEEYTFCTNGQFFLHCNANLEFNESSIQTANAMVSSGRSALVRIACTSGTEGVAKDVELGIKLARWIEGPATQGQLA